MQEQQQEKENMELQAWIKLSGNQIWWSCSSCGPKEHCDGQDPPEGRVA